MAPTHIYYTITLLLILLGLSSSSTIAPIALTSPAFDHFLRGNQLFYLQGQEIVIHDINSLTKHTEKTDSFSTAFSGEMPNGELAHFGHSGIIAFFGINPNNPNNYLELLNQLRIVDGQGTYVAFDETFVEDKEMFLVTGLYTSKVLGWYPANGKIATIFTTHPQRFIEASKMYGLALSLDGLVLTRIRLSDFKEDKVMTTHLYEGAVAMDYAWYEIEPSSNLFFVKRSDSSGFLLDLETGNMDMEYKSC